jgi:hypothetical protein
MPLKKAAACAWQAFFLRQICGSVRPLAEHRSISECGTGTIREMAVVFCHQTSFDGLAR